MKRYNSLRRETNSLLASTDSRKPTLKWLNVLMLSMTSVIDYKRGSGMQKLMILELLEAKL